MKFSSLELIDKILNFNGNSLDFLLYFYLKKAIELTKVKYGSFILFDGKGRIISMAKIGEFADRDIILKRAKQKKGILPEVLESRKPYITNDTEKDSYHFCYRKEKILSEMYFPIEFRDGKIAVLILPSEKKNHFKEKDLEHIKSLSKNFFLFIENLDNNLTKRICIFHRCNSYENFLIKTLSKKFEIVPSKNLSEIEEIYKSQLVEFIFTECFRNCFKCVKEIFYIHKNFCVPIGIIRPFSFNYKLNKNSFLCSFYSPISLSSSQEKIIELIKESKYYSGSETWEYKDKPSLNIAFIQRYILENEGKKVNVRNISERFDLSLSYLSSKFREIVGIGIQEFINKIRMCNSIFYLANGKSTKFISSKLGYEYRFSFTKRFIHTFGMSPSKLQKE